MPLSFLSGDKEYCIPAYLPVFQACFYCAFRQPASALLNISPLLHLQPVAVFFLVSNQFQYVPLILAVYTQSCHCRDVCMESTGKYWVPVFNLLEDEINVVIANPKWVKAVKGNKDDTKDSKWIGDLFRLGLVKGSYIPCKIVRILREYTRYRYKLVSCRSSEKNRYQNALTVCNVALDSVVSDIFGKSSTSIIDYLLEQSGTSINHEEINDVDKMIENMISSNPDFENAVQFLCTIPGVKRDSTITIISEIGTDMSQFSSSKRLCCWAGLTLGSNESAGKKKSVRITRAGVYLKPALVQCAHAAVKSDKSPYYKTIPMKKP